METIAMNHSPFANLTNHENEPCRRVSQAAARNTIAIPGRWLNNTGLIARFI